MECRKMKHKMTRKKLSNIQGKDFLLAFKLKVVFSVSCIYKITWKAIIRG